MNLAIIGDSFSSDITSGSWIGLLANSYKLQNYSLRGITHYRIFDIIPRNLVGNQIVADYINSKL
jgi:hypothetical protein